MNRIPNLFGRIALLAFSLTCLALVGFALYTWGYFQWAANQPMQVAEAQVVAPGITYNELRADRMAHWGQIDKRRYENGQSGNREVCVKTLPTTLGTISANLQVTVAHFNPDQGEYFRKNWDGLFPPAELLQGSLVRAWWWQVEHYAWYKWVNPAGGKSAVNFCRIVFPPARPVGAK